MNFKWFDVYGWFLSVGFVAFFICLGVFSGMVQSFFVSGPGISFGSFFVSDVISFYLTILSVFLGASLLFMVNNITSVGRFMISVSLVSSILSYSCIHGLGFWVFYEISILPLLFLLISESPYSERYVASWYLLGYVVLTSLPMLLCIFYISLEGGSMNLSLWDRNLLFNSVGVLTLLGVMFITKIPLPPFHVWLPIVHAEASSSVSVCLSGYIMKLGILGVCRFCSWVVPTHVFSSYYMVVGLWGTNAMVLNVITLPSPHHADYFSEPSRWVLSS